MKFSSMHTAFRRAFGTAALGMILIMPAGAQSLIDGFNANLDGVVYSMARQPDGRILIGGSFGFLHPNFVSAPIGRAHIARLNVDSTVDISFDCATDGDVTSIAVQADGKILIAGRFTSVLRASGTNDFVPRAGLARLNADGSLDESFDPRPSGVNVGPLALVQTVAVQADGRILIGGRFNSLQPNGAGSPITRNRIARLNADGTVDTSFDVGVNNVVLALLQQPDGRILMGGGFTEVQPAGGGSPVAQARLARLNADGTLDTTFTAVPNNRVRGFAQQADGSILVCGEFLNIAPSPGAAAVTATFVARFAPDGTLDSSFSAFPNGEVAAVAVQADGRILIAGAFASVLDESSGAPVPRRGLARLNPDGSLDPSFAPAPNAAVHAFVIQPDSSVVIGGVFSQLTPTGSITGSARQGLARLLSDGSVDAEFAPNATASVSAAGEEADGSLIVAGSFNSFGGFTQGNLIRLGPDGLVDTTFTPTISGTISRVIVQPDGKILIGGFFNFVNGVQRGNIARLNPDGTLDTAFDPNLNSNVQDMELLADGRILVAGNFTTLRPNGAATVTARRFVARLTANGAVDTDFFPNPNNAVNAVEVLSDGKYLIGGAFASLRPNDTGDAQGAPSLARLNADGTVDAEFNSGTNGTVQRVLVQADGKFIVTGTFNGIGRVTDTELTQRRFIARFNADGSPDQGFDPNPNSAVQALVQASDGSILIGGAFSTLRPNGAEVSTAVRRFAWLTNEGNLDAARTVAFNDNVAMIRPQGSSFLIGGSFNRIFTPAGVGSPVETPLVRLGAGGMLDASFVVRAGAAGGGDYVGPMALQPTGGHLIFGGVFRRVYGVNNENLMRVNATGLADAAFRPRTNGAVHALFARPDAETDTDVGGPVSWLGDDGDFRAGFDPAPMDALVGIVYAVRFQSDGKVIVAGNFSAPSSAVGANIARFNTDGSLDETFQAETNGLIRAVAVQPDGRILIGGGFTQVNGQTRNRIARLNADGTLDANYNPNASAAVRAIELTSEGQAYIGGQFSTLQPNGAAESTARRAVARLNADGSLDGTFTPVPIGDVFALALQSDGKLLIGGTFSSVSGIQRTGLARVNADGTVDETFAAQPSGDVLTITLEADGQILVGGEFVSFAPDVNSPTTLISRPFVARLNTNGAVDESFSARVNNVVNTIAVQADGRTVIGGNFTAFVPTTDTFPIFRNGIARVAEDGAVDLEFDPNADGEIFAVRLHSSDQSLVVGGDFDSFFPEPIALIGGAFTTVSDADAPYLAWINRNGSVDLARTLSPNGEVFSLAAETGATVIVGGAFTEIDGTPRERLARVDLDGQLDPAFNPAVDGAVRTVAIQPDGRILVAGDFANVGGAARQGLARLNADGTLDASFSASVDGSVTAIRTLANGQILIAGEFLTVNGTSRPYFARLDADGNLDTAFNPAPDAPVYALTVQTDGGILAGGAFDAIAGGPRARFARLLPSGALDPAVSFAIDGDVFGIAIQPDGRVLIAGDFSSVDGQARNRLARLPAFSAASEQMSVNGALTAVTLTMSGSSPEFSRVVLAQSADGETWTDLGAAARTGAAGTWTLSGVSFPADTIFYVRARGVTTNTRYASSGRREIVWQFYNTTSAIDLPSTSGGGSSPVGSGGASGGSSGSGGNGGGSSGGGSGSGGGSAGGGSGGSGGDVGSGGTTAELGLRNLSGRGVPIVDQPLIGGFVIGGSAERTVLLRGVGPGLADFGLTNVMARPTMRLFNKAGAVIREVEPGNSVAMTTDGLKATGAFPLDPTREDTAFVMDLAPGSYTFHIFDADGLGGIALAEVYVADQADSGHGLANVSIRGYAGTGAEVLIAGFVSDSPTPRRVLIRGVGPGLDDFGVPDTVVDPVIRVFNSDREEIGANDDWGVQPDMTAADMAAIMSSVGAFPLADGSEDAALVITLPNGGFTIHLSGTVAGSGLVEIYEAP